MGKRQRQPTRTANTTSEVSSNLNNGDISTGLAFTTEKLLEQQHGAGVIISEPSRSRQQQNAPFNTTSSADTAGKLDETPTAYEERDLPSSNTQSSKGLGDWILNERESFLWIVGCAALGAFIGFAVGCGWFTYGYGSYELVVHENDAVDVSPTAVREYVVSAWRVALAGKIRDSYIYNLVMTKLVLDSNNLDNDESDGFLSWISTSTLWPPNWMLGSNIDLQKLSVGDQALSPITASFLSFVLPWRRPLIKVLARKIPGNVPGSPPAQLPSSFKTMDPIDPYYHPMAFHSLREHIIRFKRGFVHPDLGFLVPAPSGAARGIGMVRDSYNKCQIHCYPGTSEEMIARANEYERYEQELNEEREIMEEMKELYPDLASREIKSSMDEINPSFERLYSPLKTTTLKEVQHALHHQSTATSHPYTQHTLMLRIPIEVQITRKTALEIITPLVPDDIKASLALDELDDGPLLALLLTHETGLGSSSQFWPYIATLPPHPSCAMHRAWRQSIVDVLTALSLQMGTDVHGWPNEISKASEALDSIGANLIGVLSYLEFSSTRFKNHHEAFRWSLCQVASRAIAGKENHGRLRLVPMMDMINHDADADVFIELTGDEKVENGFFVDAFEEDAGAFVVRSQRHGRRKVLKKGQELMANYNVPHYSPLDWFINMGYVPPEREGSWTMLDAGLPREKRLKYNTPVPGENSYCFLRLDLKCRLITERSCFCNQSVVTSDMEGLRQHPRPNVAT